MNRAPLALIAALALATVLPRDAGAKDRWRPLDRETGAGADTTIVGFEVNAIDEHAEAARFVCRCREDEMELYVIADTTVVGAGASRSVSVFVDQQPATYESWLASSNRRSLFAREPESLAHRLRAARALELGIRVDGGRTATLRFDVRGFEGVMRVVQLDCPARVAKRPPPTAPLPIGGNRPFGEYVYVEELPEAIKKIAPTYPSAVARGTEGTVIVQALIGTDGRVIDTKVVKSTPAFDDAAVVAVKQWLFKPALSHGQPVQVWVAVPVKFSAP